MTSCLEFSDLTPGLGWAPPALPLPSNYWLTHPAEGTQLVGPGAKRLLCGCGLSPGPLQGWLPGTPSTPKSTQAKGPMGISAIGKGELWGWYNGPYSPHTPPCGMEAESCGEGPRPGQQLASGLWRSLWKRH